MSVPVLPEVNCYRVRAHTQYGTTFVLSVIFDTREDACARIKQHIDMPAAERPVWLELADGGVVKDAVVIALAVEPWYQPERAKPKRKRGARA
jgi:hypothetical protein